MPISDKHKVVFIHIPKNGGTSVEKNLNMFETGHKNWSYYKSRYPDRWKNYESLAVIRNPFDRLVSCYNYAKMESSYWHSSDGNAIYGKHPDYNVCNELEFNQLMQGFLNGKIHLKQLGWTPQCKWISGPSGIMVDRLILIEDLSQWMDNLCATKTKKLNTSRGEGDNWESYYSRETKDLVLKNFPTDFKIYKELKNAK
jgi:hypothetical protein